MRFRQIIHPELLLNRRGDKLVRESLSRLLGEVWLTEQGVSATAKVQALSFGDLNLLDALALMGKWRDSERKIYHVGGDFLTEISKVDRSIPVENLPETFLAYISLGKDAIRDEESPIQGAYVYVGPAHGSSFGHTDYVSSTSAKVIWIAYMTDEHFGGKAGTLRLELKPNQTMRQLLASISSIDINLLGIVDSQEISVSKREIVFRTLINIILYINQPDPDLERLIPHNSLIGRKHDQLLTKSAKGTAVFNSCTLPVTFVNWRWHKPLAEHTVSGHFKWQPCGNNLIHRKLIYVETYERCRDDKICLPKIAIH